MNDGFMENYQSKYLNNEVLVDINEKLSRSLDADVELIILFFENAKLTGGCDTIASRYDKITKKLFLNYKFYEIKKIILEKKYFYYKDYSFVVLNSTFSYLDIHKMCSNNVFMLYNINTSEDKAIIELYVEYLVDISTGNEVLEIKKSSLFDKTLLVYLKNEFNLNNLRKRYAKKPKFRENFIQFYEGYKTNVLFGKIISIKGNQVDNDLDELVFDYLDKAFNETTKSYWQLLFKAASKNKFIIIKFDCEDYLQACLTEKKHEISNDKMLIFEQCFNYKFFDAFVDENFRILNQNIDEDEDYDFDEKILNNFNQISITKNSYFNENNETLKLINDLLESKSTASAAIVPNPDEEEDEDEIKEEESYYYEFNEDNQLEDLLKSSPKVLQDLNMFLAKSNSVAVKEDDDSVYIHSIDCKLEYEQWLRDIDDKVNEFSSKNNFKIILFAGKSLFKIF